MVGEMIIDIENLSKTSAFLDVELVIKYDLNTLTNIIRKKILLLINYKIIQEQIQESN